MNLKEYDVFLSYHGGNGDDNKSSYPMAEKLYFYLKERGLSPFLCKKAKTGDFYDDINDAILGSRHFVLVACEKDMLSEWVKDEVKQFDSLRKNGKKPYNIMTAYIFGKITEEDLYSFNTVFATKDIAAGDDGFEKIYNAIVAKDEERARLGETAAAVDPHVGETDGDGCTDFDGVSDMFLQSYFTSHEHSDKMFDSKDGYLRSCEIITQRLKCMLSVTIPKDCTNVIFEYYNRILGIENKSNPNVMQIAGQSGTQKSYVLQLLYIQFRSSMGEHNFDPVYINCDLIRSRLDEGAGSDFLESVFAQVKQRDGRDALFIIDGIRNIVADDYRLDYAIKNLSDKYRNVRFIVGKSLIDCDNPVKHNKSYFAKGQYEIVLRLSPISLYEREKCYNYFSTFNNLPLADPRDIYDKLHDSGLLTINEYTLRKVCGKAVGGNSPKIIDVFEEELLNCFDGDEETLKRMAAVVFRFAYGNDEIDYADKDVKKALGMICNDQIYLYCFIALCFTYRLDEYDRTGDFSFFRFVFPKEITRFITQRIHEYTKYEESILSLAEHYNEMSAMGKSEMSFFLGRIESENLRIKAIALLKKYYKETENDIKQKLIDRRYNGRNYTHNDYKQDLFLLRGLSVSLIYCKEKPELYAYLHSLIDNDLSNSVNRGFHLEYYGDKRYLPNQNELTYDDNPKLGERTLRVLCNSIEIQLEKKEYHPALLLDLFTVASLLQVRIEMPKMLLSFNITEYIKRYIEFAPRCLDAVKCDDNVLVSFFDMAADDFKLYLEFRATQFSPQCSVCSDYLSAIEVKRAGWVAQSIPQPESIVEHMYSCWFIGLVCLPSEDDEYAEYDKQKILDMLLIHDLAETKLGDIPKYEKADHPDYNRYENAEMLSLLLKGTYGRMNALTPFVAAWDEWYKFETINAKIAKDIDTLQAIYQFLVYYKSHPELFKRERVIGWLDEMKCIRTARGRKIVEEIILNNDAFAEILREYGYTKIW